MKCEGWRVRGVKCEGWRVICVKYEGWRVMCVMCEGWRECGVWRFGDWSSRLKILELTELI